MPKSDAKVFEVKIKINGSDPDLRPAMTTSNTIQIDVFEDVLSCPNQKDGSITARIPAKAIFS